MKLLDIAAIAAKNEATLLGNNALWQRMRGEMPECITCGCRGNMECGHEPLGAPDHNCELSPTLECYCCLMKRGHRITKQGHVLQEVMK